MPLYDYACAACARRFEVIHGVHDDGPTSCPLCGKGPVRKVITAASVHYKGSGWAKKERRAAVKSAASVGGGDEGSSDAGSSGTETGASTDAASKDAGASTDGAGASPPASTSATGESKKGSPSSAATGPSSKTRARTAD